MSGIKTNRRTGPARNGKRGYAADALQRMILVDALELMIIPSHSAAKTSFPGRHHPRAFKVTSSQVAPKGIIIATTNETAT
jgi:hypothetical protein